PGDALVEQRAVDHRARATEALGELADRRAAAVVLEDALAVFRGDFRRGVGKDRIRRVLLVVLADRVQDGERRPVHPAADAAADLGDAAMPVDCQSPRAAEHLESLFIADE